MYVYVFLFKLQANNVARVYNRDSQALAREDTMIDVTIELSNRFFAINVHHGAIRLSVR